MDPEFLQKLICPRTHKPLRLADADELRSLNARIAAGGIRNRGGKPVDRALDGALMVESEPFAYPLLDEIPVLLVDEAIPLSDDGGAPSEEGQ